MMSKTLALILAALLVAAVLAVVVWPASSNTSDVIIVSNADAHRQMDVVGDGALNSLLGQVGARLRVQFADVLRRIDLQQPPAAITSALGSVQARIRLSFGDVLRHVDLSPAPAPLASALGSVRDRIRLSYANSSRRMALTYPVELVDDHTPPALSNVASTASGNVSWTTNEFATSVVRYGTASGVYTQTVSSSLFVKQHHLQMTGLQAGVRYYYVVSSVDLSGNVTTSSEYTIVQRQSIYLPSIIR